MRRRPGWLVLLAAASALAGAPAPAADAAPGSVRDLGGLDGCLSSGGTPDCRPVDAAHGVMEIAMTADGQYAYSTAFFEGRIQALRRDPMTGKLEPINAVKTVDKPHGVALSPDGKNVYAVSGPGVDVLDRDAATGAISSAGFVHGGLEHSTMDTYASGIDVSADGKFVYAVIRQVNAIVVFARDLTTGALTRVPGQTGCVSERGRLDNDPDTVNSCTAAPGMEGLIDITIAPGGAHLYTVSDQRDSIAVLTRNATTGKLTPAAGAAACVSVGGKWSWPNDDDPLASDQKFDCSANSPYTDYLNGITFSANGAHAYVSGRSGMAVYTRNTSTGALTALPGKDGCTLYWETPDDVCHHTPRAHHTRRAWIRPDGKRVHAVIGEDDGVLTWERNTATGGLRPLKGQAGCTGDPFFFRRAHPCAPSRHLAGGWFGIGSPDGKHFYAGSLWESELISFALMRTAFSPEMLDFFVQEVGQTAAARTITVRNEGTAAITITDVSIGGPDASSYAIASRTCEPNVRLAVNATCTVSVSFTPTKKAYLDATLDIASTGSATSPDSAALRGIGIITQPPPPRLVQLPGDQGCLTADGREDPADATTAGRCRPAPAVAYNGANGTNRSGPNDVLVSPDGNNLYTAAWDFFAARTGLAGLTRDAATGLLDPVAGAGGCFHQPVVADCGAVDGFLPVALAISPDGKSLYAGSSRMEGFASFDRDPATGALTKRPGCFSFDGGWDSSTTADGTPCTVVRSMRNPYSFHVAPDGENLYAVAQQSITVFDRDPVTGDVTPRTGQTKCLSIDGDLEWGAPNDNGCTVAGGTRIMKRMAFAPNANHVYVGGAYHAQAGHTDAITLFDRAADGSLTRRATPTAKDGCIAWNNGAYSSGACRTARAVGVIRAWTLSPDGKNIYVAGDQRGIAVIDRDPTTGLLSEHPIPNGCITETGRAGYNDATSAGQCRVGGAALRDTNDLSVTPDGSLVVTGASFGRNTSDPPSPPRYYLGGVSALSRDSTGALTMTGCYSSSTRSLASEPITTGECGAARGLNSSAATVDVTPDGKHVYFGVQPNDSPSGSGLALFRVVPTDEPAPGPGVYVDAADASVRESDGNAVFDLQLTAPAVRETSVQYTTFDGTATAGADYDTRSGTATIPQGQTAATVSVPVTQDGAPEHPETFGLRITGADGAVLGEPEGFGSLTDDDGRPPPPAVSIGGAEVVETDGPGAVLRFPLTRAPAEAPDVSSLSWSIVGGTADAGEDYTESSGSLTVMPLGAPTIDVPVNGDDVVEGDETIVVRLSDAYAATLGTTDATGTIREDDTAPAAGGNGGGAGANNGGGGGGSGGGGGGSPAAPAPPARAPVLVPPTKLATLPAPAAAPKPAVLGLPAAKRCASRRRFRISVKPPRGETARSALVLVNGKQAKSLTGAKVSAPVDLRGLPKGKFTVKVTLTTASGKTLTQTRSYKTCAPKKKKRKR